ncbi:MAG: methyltransferase [Armatimonadetes bacterium]|nr:methyltransferase [Armatimonadota bacterium]
MARDGETLDRLAGDWRIFQLRRGHRFSTDDLMTAWTAARAQPAARRLLDLGSGIGSVGLLTMWKLGAEAELLGVEVQPVSLELARRTAAYNRVCNRAEFRPGDLRDPELLAGERPFELITGSPPYIPPERGVQSPHPQRAAARIELHGDVFDYCRAAAWVLSPEGRFCFCHAAADPRPEPAIQSAGLRLLRRQDVVFRAGQPPLIALFTCGFSHQEPPRTAPEFVIRDENGRWTDEYLAMRREMGTVVWNQDHGGESRRAVGP